MQMHKKVTLKEDGRFLVYYHFPDTATAEETQVFAGIEGQNDERGMRRDESESSSLLSTHTSSLPNTGGVPNV